MTRIVYNSCFGGFSISHEAVELYAKLTNKTLRVKPLTFGGKTYNDSTFQTYYLNDKYFSTHDLSRTDPTLLAIIDEIGLKRASGCCASLAIIDLAPGTKYRIDEYDGDECVCTIDEYEWSIA